jgi:hypothetical protein
MILKQAVLAGAGAVFAFFGTVNSASAHAISIGFENAGPSSVNIWLGTYSVGHGYQLEGSLQLQGVLGTVFGPVVSPFTMLTPISVGSKPAGLIDGVTNFYAPDATSPLVGSEAPFNAFCPACGPVDEWEGVKFTGLSSGNYRFTYIPIANPTQEWIPLNPNLNGTFDLTAVVVPTPEPSTIFLFLIAGSAFLLGRPLHKRQGSN